MYGSIAEPVTVKTSSVSMAAEHTAPARCDDTVR